MAKTYGKRRVLDNVSFAVGEGEVFALVGPNGAGKTTTLRIVVGLLRPDSGDVRILGLNAGEARRRRLVGYLPEEADLYARLTGYEHVRLYARLYGVDEDEAVEIAREISGLGDALARRAGEYSKGMKRRLLVALALLTRPRLAVLDEPTSGLDVQSSVRVRELIRGIARGTGTAVLLSSHNMLEVEHVCDRVGFINRGRIIEVGTPEEVLEKYGARDLEEAFVKLVGE
ncbi:MAG: ABC transporter ATP-binding protein [Desulfurococcaceae archaeon]